MSCQKQNFLQLRHDNGIQAHMQGRCILESAKGLRALCTPRKLPLALRHLWHIELGKVLQIG